LELICGDTRVHRYVSINFVKDLRGHIRAFEPSNFGLRPRQARILETLAPGENEKTTVAKRTNKHQANNARLVEIN
jgi:hypothetical protein